MLISLLRVHIIAVLRCLYLYIFYELHSLLIYMMIVGVSSIKCLKVFLLST